jgi:hypothetical protein
MLVNIQEKQAVDERHRQCCHVIEEKQQTASFWSLTIPIGRQRLKRPVYLDKEIKAFYNKKAQQRKIDLNKVVNTVLRKEMAMLKAIGA